MPDAANTGSSVAEALQPDLTEAVPIRVATVDVGTNSLRLLVAEVHPDGTYRLLDDEKVVTRLGRGTSSCRMLDPEAMRESARAVAHMKTIAEGYNVQALRAVATCAVREADNRDVFLELVRQEAGVELQVISGEEEGRLAFLSVKAAFDVRSRNVAVVDIGGGSTEIVLASGGMIEQISSLSIGAVRLTEMVHEPSLRPEGRLKLCRKRTRSALKENLRRPEAPPTLMIGTGGTFTTLASIILAHRRGFGGSEDASSASVRGCEVKRADLRRLLERLNGMSLKERASVPGLSPDRVEIIVAGLAIADTVMKKLGVNLLQVHDRGIRDGILLNMVGELFPNARTVEPFGGTGHNRLQSVRRFAEKCRYERDHSEHVTLLALEIHDQLCEQLPKSGSTELWREPAARGLLQAAGILHDIGYYINYSRHHKHSYHLIIHSELPGFSHRELEIIANVARYHRRAHPRQKHASFAQLAPPDQAMVRQLSAILRAADGLDRAHAQNVRSVQVKIERGSAYFLVESPSEPEVDLWGAARKSRLFFNVFGLEPRFLWNG